MSFGTGQAYSLWPAFAEASEGCIVAHKEDTRKACLDFIEENLTDMRPDGLIEQMRQDEEEARQNENGQTAEVAAKNDGNDRDYERSR